MRLLSLAACVGCSLSLWAQNPSLKPNQQAAQELVNQLNSPSFSTRENASKELESLGEPARAALTEALKHANSEVRTRAEEILERIARRHDSLQQTTSKLFKLDYVNKPLSFVLADFKAKTTLPITMEWPRNADQSRLVTVTTPQEVNAWQALEALLQQAGLREIYREEIPANPNESNRNPDYGYMAYANQSVAPSKVPIWLTLGTAETVAGDRTSAVRILVLPPNFPGHRLIRGAGQLQLCLDVTPLASVGWTQSQSVLVSRAEDETGRPVMMSHRPINDGLGNLGDNDEWNGFGGRVVFFGGGMGRAWYPYGGGAQTPTNSRVTNVTLRTQDRSIKQLKIFEGKVVGQQMLADQLLGTVENLSKDGEKRVQAGDDTTVTVLNYQKRMNGSISIKIRQEEPSRWETVNIRGAWTSRMVERAPIRLKFYDEKGNQLPQPYSMGSSSMDNGVRQTMDTEWIFDVKPNLGTPIKLVVTGSKPKLLEVPFRLTNVTLP